MIEFGHLSTETVAALPSDTVAVQPIGAVEQHGPHLPVVTDALVAEQIARRAVEATDAPAVLLPTLSYGRSTEHLGFPGTIALSARTLIEVCLDVGRSLPASGIRKLVFVNGHGGQPYLLEMVARDIRAETGIEVFVVTPMRFGLPEGVTIGDEAYGIHGGELETSVVLALAPDLVDLSRARPDGRAAADLFEECRHLTLEGTVPTAWLTADLSKSGVIGDPRPATARVGAAVVDHWTSCLATTLGEVQRFAFPAELP